MLHDEDFSAHERLHQTLQCPEEGEAAAPQRGGGRSSRLEEGRKTESQQQKNGGGRFNCLRATQPGLKIRQVAAATGVQDDLIPRSGYPIFYKLNAKKQIQHDTQFIT